MLAALGEEDVQIKAYWLEEAAPDSPWGLQPPPFPSQVLRGICLGSGRIRSHVNWGLPETARCDLVLVNTSLTDVTTQWLMRMELGNRPWLFWGERQRKGWMGAWLAGPLGRASGIIAVGARAASDYAARFPEVRVWNIPYHCELKGFRDQPARPGISRELTFLFCGQMIRRKGVDLIVAAFVRLLEEKKEARLMLVGRPDREGEEVLGQVPERFRDRIEPVGFVQPEKLPEWFARADVFVLPSRREGWGVVVNQAAAAGLPLIVSDAVEAGQEWLKPGENGWRVEAGNVESLTTAMREAVNDREGLAKMGGVSASLASSRGPEAGAAKLRAALEEVLG